MSLLWAGPLSSTFWLLLFPLVAIWLEFPFSTHLFLISFPFDQFFRAPVY
jgi:hypothetical protein